MWRGREAVSYEEDGERIKKSKMRKCVGGVNGRAGGGKSKMR